MDKYVAINNFKWGLDARKSELTTQPGALLQLINAHINSGGEAEQRKSFARDATNYPTGISGTFGLEVTSAGLVTFGSVVSPGSLPTGVTYQRLPNPAVGSLSGMDSVIFSCNYLGNAFVIAHYADGGVFGFYNGVLIADFRNGLVLNIGGSETLSQLGDDLAAIINAITGWSAVNSSGVVTVQSPPGVHFTPVTSQNSASGELGAQLLAQNGPGTSPQSAFVSFQLTGGASGSVTVTAPATSGGSGTAALTNGAVNFDTSLGQTAVDIAAAINSNTYITGYTAAASLATATVTVYAPAAWGAVTFAITVTPVTITVAGGSTVNLFSLIMSPSTVDVDLTSNVAKFVYGSIQAQTKGAINTVSFAWHETDGSGTDVSGNPSGITISSTGNTPNVTFSKYFIPNANPATGYFRCTATDSGGATGSPATVFFSVTLQLESSS